MKRKILSGLLAMTLIISLAIQGTTASASGVAVGSSVNGSGGNGGIEIPQKPVKPQKPQKPVITPVVSTTSGAKMALSVVSAQKQEDSSLLIGGVNAGEDGLLVNGGTENADGTVTLGGGDLITTQEERQSILKEAETTIMVTQSTVLEEMLDNFTEKETTAQTASEDAMEKLVENGASVSDAVRTAAISNAVKNSETVSETLENLSEDAKSQVQEAVKDSALKLQEVTEKKMKAAKTVLGLMEQMEVSRTEAVDVSALKEAMAAQNPEEAAVFEGILGELETKNIVVTPAVIEQVVQNQEAHLKGLKELADGNVDSLTVHSVIDISVSDDVKEMVSEDGNYVEVPVNMPGIEEDTLVVILKPVQGTAATLEEEVNFRELQAEVNAGNTKDILQKMDNRFTIIPCTPYDGGVVLEMTSFSPIMVLTYADTTTEVAFMAEEAIGMETAADSRNILRPVVLAAAVIVVGTAAVYTAKKKSGN